MVRGVKPTKDTPQPPIEVAVVPRKALGEVLAGLNVHSPKHYTQGYLESIYVIQQTLGPEGFKAFCMGNWIKYNERAKHKGGAEDLAKADQYLEWAVNGLPKPVNGMVPR